MTKKQLTQAEKKSRREKARFLFSNMTRGWIWLALIVGLFLVLEWTKVDYYRILTPLYDHPALLYGSFVFSEVFFGIIPPELYMVWARGYENLVTYIEIVAALGVISYGAGVLGYWIGRWFSDTQFYRKLAEKQLSKFIPLLKKYGIFLIVVAALTPVPYSASCMLMGSVRYPVGKFLLITLFRLLRFGVYGFVIWKSTGI